MSGCPKNKNYRTVNDEQPKLDVTKEEFARIHEALRNEEFRKLFFEYLEEIQDPENRKRYEEELKLFEKERGVEVVFLHPQPGFVVKTAVNGELKGFINIASCTEIAAPSTQHAVSPDTGRPGLSWALPIAQSPARDDIDAKGKRCRVYDVMFHPKALELAQQRSELRKHLIETALDAVEREQHVRLDRANLKFPKLDYKGVAKPVVIRKLAKNASAEQLEPHPLEHIYPARPTSEAGKPKLLPMKTTGPSCKPDYSTPKYFIKHSHNVDLAEYTDELDAKLNLTVPHALVIDIELPLLANIEHSELDVTAKTVHFRNDRPGAKYALQLNLPYAVDDKAGSAKFDAERRRLTVNLPVVRPSAKEERERHNVLRRNDSGVELHCSSEGEDASEGDEHEEEIIEVNTSDESPAAEKFYKLPEKFSCNLVELSDGQQLMAFVLEVRNVQERSIQVVQQADQAFVRFSSIGSGYYTVDYAFHVSLMPEDALKCRIVEVEAEAWENNLVFNLKLSNQSLFRRYLAGNEAGQLQEYTVNSVLEQQMATNEQLETSLAELNIEGTLNEEANIKQSPPVSVEAKDSSDDCATKMKTKASKKQRKHRNKKQRSASESECYELSRKSQPTESIAELPSNTTTALMSSRKQRSVSECHDVGMGIAAKDNKVQKGILKRVSRYESLTTTSSSSFEEQNLSVSCPDVAQNGEPDCCKKSVRFNDHIFQQTFRCDSSILGRRKKNQKCRERKLRAMQRRLSESDSLDYYEANMKAGDDKLKLQDRNGSDKRKQGSKIKKVQLSGEAVERLSFSLDEGCSSSDDYQTPLASEISD